MKLIKTKKIKLMFYLQLIKETIAMAPDHDIPDTNMRTGSHSWG